MLTRLRVFIEMIRISLPILAIAVFVVLGSKVHQAYYWGCFAAIPIELSLWELSRRRVMNRRVEELRETWGKPQEEPSDLGWFRDQYALWTRRTQSGFEVDDRTWDDLCMDEVFAKTDRTLTHLGEACLYGLLRVPVTEESILKERGRVVAAFQHKQQAREDIQLELRKLGKRSDLRLHHLHDDMEEQRTALRTVCRLLACLAVFASGVALVSLRPEAAFIIAPLLIINGLLAQWIRGMILSHMNRLLYLGAAVSCGGGLGRIDEPALRTYTDKIAGLARTLAPIERKTRFFRLTVSASSELADLILECANAFFLKEALAYFKLLELMSAQRGAVMELLLSIGELDALQSIASFREGLPFYTEPVFAAPGGMLELADGCHPVLDEAIPNSISVDKNSVVITGANMSGKSTFLRTVAVNALMAQSVYTCYAAFYKAPFFVILSCMRVSDALSESKSLYFAEAEQLLAMVRAADGNTPVLCVIDEPLSGTNGPERVSAALEILRYLACHRALVVAATHDMDVALGLLDEYQAYHFNDPFLGANEADRYRIRVGLDYDSNALLLLEKLGFCPAIVDGARARLEKIRLSLGNPGTLPVFRRTNRNNGSP